MHKTLPTNPSLPAYLYTSSGYLLLQSLLLLSSPRLVVTLLSSDTLRPPTTDLESYLCRALGWALITLAGISVAEALSLSRVGEGEDDSLPPTFSVLPIVVGYHAISAVQGYINYSSPSGPVGTGGNSIFAANAAIAAGMVVYGLWVVMFGREVRVSSKDGSDKRVSGFLFGSGGKGKNA